MPLIRIELAAGKSPEFKQQLMSLVGNVVVRTLQLPADDRNVRLLEYDANCFTMKYPYEIIIEITLFAGRKKETKKLLYKTLVETLSEKLDIAKANVFIVLNEQPLENWGVRGGISADDVKLGFSVNV
jgi:phenylpyruvate tautomerase PptA (4-oxalocrotonate tautomerase family)